MTRYVLVAILFVVSWAVNIRANAQIAIQIGGPPFGFYGPMVPVPGPIAMRRGMMIPPPLPPMMRPVVVAPVPGVALPRVAVPAYAYTSPPTRYAPSAGDRYRSPAETIGRANAKPPVTASSNGPDDLRPGMVLPDGSTVLSVGPIGPSATTQAGQSSSANPQQPTLAPPQNTAPQLAPAQPPTQPAAESVPAEAPKRAAF